MSFPPYSAPPTSAVPDRYFATVQFETVPRSAEEAAGVVRFDLLPLSSKSVLLAAVASDFEAAADPSQAPRGLLNNATHVKVWLRADATGAERLVEVLFTRGVSGFAPETLHNVLAALHSTGSLLPSFQAMYNAFVGPQVVRIGAFSAGSLFQVALEVDIVDDSVHPTQRSLYGINFVRSGAVLANMAHDVATFASIPPELVAVDVVTRLDDEGPRIARARLVLLATVSSSDLTSRIALLPAYLPMPRTALALYTRAVEQGLLVVSSDDRRGGSAIAVVHGMRADRAEPPPKHGSSCGDGCMTPVILSCVVCGITFVVLYVAFAGDTEQSAIEHAEGLANEQLHDEARRRGAEYAVRPLQPLPIPVPQQQQQQVGFNNSLAATPGAYIINNNNRTPSARPPRSFGA